MQSTERKRMTAEERELFAALFALDNILDKFSGRYQRLCQRVPGLAGLPHSSEQDSKCYHKAAGYRACRAAVDRQATTRPNRNPHRH